MTRDGWRLNGKLKKGLMLGGSCAEQMSFTIKNIPTEMTNLWHMKLKAFLKQKAKSFDLAIGRSGLMEIIYQHLLIRFNTIFFL